MSNTELIERLLQGNLKLKYDAWYLENLKSSLGARYLPVTSKKYRYTFETYTRALKLYAEEKYFSGVKNLLGFTQTVRAQKLFNT